MAEEQNLYSAATPLWQNFNLVRNSTEGTYEIERVIKAFEEGNIGTSAARLLVEDIFLNTAEHVKPEVIMNAIESLKGVNVRGLVEDGKDAAAAKELTDQEFGRLINNNINIGTVDEVLDLLEDKNPIRAFSGKWDGSLDEGLKEQKLEYDKFKDGMSTLIEKDGFTYPEHMVTFALEMMEIGDKNILDTLLRGEFIRNSREKRNSGTIKEEFERSNGEGTQFAGEIIQIPKSSLIIMGLREIVEKLPGEEKYFSDKRKATENERASNQVNNTGKSVGVETANPALAIEPLGADQGKDRTETEATRLLDQFLGYQCRRDMKNAELRRIMEDRRKDALPKIDVAANSQIARLVTQLEEMSGKGALIGGMRILNSKQNEQLLGHKENRLFYQRARGEDGEILNTGSLMVQFRDKAVWAKDFLGNDGNDKKKQSEIISGLGPLLKKYNVPDTKIKEAIKDPERLIRHIVGGKVALQKGQNLNNLQADLRAMMREKGFVAAFVPGTNDDTKKPQLQFYPIERLDTYLARKAENTEFTKMAADILINVTPIGVDKVKTR